MPATGDVEGGNSEIGQGKKRSPESFCFHSLVPLPPQYSQRAYGDGRPGNGFDLECETWGVKWGAYDQKKPVLENGLATYRFTTAWSAPTKFVGKVYPQWPALYFWLSWGGEGPTRGRATFGANDPIPAVIQDEKYRKEDYPREEDFDDDEEAHRAYKAVEQLRMTEHPFWVARQIAVRSGMEFAEGACEPLYDWILERGLDKLAASMRKALVTLS